MELSELRAGLTNSRWSSSVEQLLLDSFTDMQLDAWPETAWIVISHYITYFWLICVCVCVFFSHRTSCWPVPDLWVTSVLWTLVCPDVWTTSEKSGRSWAHQSMWVSSAVWRLRSQNHLWSLLLFLSFLISAMPFVLQHQRSLTMSPSAQLQTCGECPATSTYSQHSDITSTKGSFYV